MNQYSTTVQRLEGNGQAAMNLKRYTALGKTLGQDNKTVRVGAYCRVSTDMEEQQSSLELQITSFREQIEQHSGWELVDIYADEGISGGSAQKRKDFQRMVQDSKDGKLDYIITKSISRFARNTLECLAYVRQLQKNGTQIFFEKENIDTGTAFSEMLLTILAAFAQEESRSLSESAKWGIRKRFEAGQEKRANVFGYRFDTEHNYIIEPTEAATVHRIFDLYETGRYSMNAIAQKMLEEKRASANSMKWDASHIHVILNNEKYNGDVLMQKKYTVDHMTHREVKNNNRTLPQFYVRNHHIPIIERKQYERCQKIAWLKSLRGKSDQYPYDDLLVCPVCGKRMQKHGMTANIGHTAWQCDREDGCRQYTVIGKYVDAAVLDAYKQIDPEQVNKLTTDRNADAAKALLEMKKKRPVFHNVDFWWLDELVERITFGKNYSVTVHWKCGLQTSGQMAITNHKYDPVYLADRNRNAETRNQNELNFLELASELLTQSDTMEEAIAGIRKASRKVTDCISTR